MTLSQNPNQTEAIQEQVEEQNAEAVQSVSDGNDLQPSDEPVDPIEQARREEREKVKAEMQAAVNKRIDKEVWKRKTVENQAKELRSIIEQMQPKEPEKKYSDFNSDEEYIDYKVEQKLKSTQKQSVTTQPVGDEEIYGDVVKSFTEQEQEYIKSNPDYNKNIVNLAPYLNKNFKEALYHATPEITDYLARNLEDAEYISSLPPIKMGIEIANLKGNLPQKNSEKKAEPTKPRVPPPPSIPRATAGGQKTFNANELNDHDHFVYLSKKRLGLIK